ncbi:RluA family pseudouridine synthase [Marinobacter sp. X15-166B]|uniref:RluA family pseudouridine synthase n=1 Tax=Marinobacter sp. X15-166B TaxID=1897620 RepID=UPI00085CBDA1|nr:RluA family pseudouridine synthase [Marinobacter sp. X15-166B]OEY65563.1 RNA pseudouridine synthase [Marinobacter sp. X15-166B]
MRTTVDLIVPQPGIAVDILSEASGLPKGRIKDAMAKGACWWTLKGKQVRLRKAKREAKAGTRLQLYYDARVLAREPEAPELLEDKGRYSVWFKPHGLLAQGSQWGDHCSLLRLAEVQLNRPCHLIHRLDADAAGLMMIAHDTKAAGALSQHFSGRTMTKHYLARVCGLLDARHQRISTPIDGKEASTCITTLSVDEASNTSLIEVDIDTGRKHQIRRHLAGIGHPIVADRLYGTPASVPLQLLACYLAFDCPLTRARVEFQLPERLQSSIMSE